MTLASFSNTSESSESNGQAFAEMGLCPEIVRTLIASGYTAPTPVQKRAIPAALMQRDLVVSSPTGSGKTAAFMLPAIQRFAQLRQEKTGAAERSDPMFKQGHDRRRRQPIQPARPTLLVLTPTRELAVQVNNAAKIYGQYLKRLQTISILGGVPYRRQLEMLSKKPDIIVATPGRVLDHLEHGRINLSTLSMLVLDEADRMLDMGFIDDIETIVAATPTHRQTLLFSATIDRRIHALTERLLNSPEHIEITSQVEQRTNIAQSIHWVDDRAHKDRLLMHLLSDETLSQAVVFTATKSSADELSQRLSEAGFSSAALHGDLPQGARNRTIRALRDQRVSILVATDVAARGIDVPTITHVFNYDLPKFAEDYVHRIGRTGRAGRSGKAVSLVHHAESKMLRRIEQFTRQTLPIKVVEGFEPRRPGPSTSFARNGHRRSRPSSSSGGYRNGAGGRSQSYGEARRSAATRQGQTSHRAYGQNKPHNAKGNNRTASRFR